MRGRRYRGRGGDRNGDASPRGVCYAYAIERPDPAGETRETLSPWRLGVVASFALGLAVLPAATEGAIVGHRLVALGRGAGTLGTMSFVGLVIAMIAQPVVGTLSDHTRTRLGRRAPYLIVGTAGVLAALAGIVAAPTVVLIGASLCLSQLASNTVQGPWQALVPDRVPSSQRGLVSTFKALFEIVGSIVGRVGAGAIVATAAARGEGVVWLAAGMPALAFVAALALTLPLASRDVGGERAPEPHERVAVLAFLRQSAPFRAWMLNRVLFWSAFNGVTTFLLFFAMDVLRQTEPEAQATIAKLGGVLGVAILLAAVPIGKLSDRHGRAPFLALGGVLSALGTALMLASPHMLVVAAAALLVGLGASAFLGTSFALVTELVPQRHAARFLGLANVATVAAAAFARLVFGNALDWLKLETGSARVAYGLVYGACAVAFAASAVVAVRALPRHAVPPA